MRVAPLVLGGCLAVACNSGERSAFEPNNDAGLEGGTGFPDAADTCTTLDCKRAVCAQGRTTTLSGKVYDPAGANPLHNVLVYVPSTDGALPPLEDAAVTGVKCGPCDSKIVNPVASALTDTTGSFRLDDVPVDANLPVVVQVGKWRRKLHVDSSKACEDNAVPDKALRLPANGKEGDMPRIAVAAAGADGLECLLRGIGIDESEFVPGHDGPEHVHLFNAIGGQTPGPSVSGLWDDVERLKQYDMTLLSCEGEETVSNKPHLGTIAGYLNAGGRVFASHYQYVWFGRSPSPEIRGLANFNALTGSPVKAVHNINMSFPKGEALAHWLTNVGTSPLGKLELEDIRDSVQELHRPAIPWILSESGRPRYFSFNTPVSAPAAEQCGRAVFSDLHVTQFSSPTIARCTPQPGELNEQQKALEFFLFDLSACIVDDDSPPTVPK